MKRKIVIFCSLAVILVTLAIVAGVAVHNFMAVVTLKVDRHMTIFQGGGGNSVVLTSDNGNDALIVDTKFFSAAKYLRNVVKAKNITIVNTHYHLDHNQGNELYTNALIISGGSTQNQQNSSANQNKNTYKNISNGDEMKIDIDSETVHILNMGRAHSTDDCVIYFEKRKLLVSGDLVFVNWHPPYADPACNISLWINALERMQKQFDIKTLVPGHGNISDQTAISTMKEYFVSITEAIDDPEKLEVIRGKYNRYFALPFMSSFNKTITFIKNKNGGKQ